MGGLFGGALARAGHPVTLIVRPEAAASHPRVLRVESDVLGSFEAPVEVAARLSQPVDVLWVSVKATALEALAQAPASALGEGVAIPLLNGADHMKRLRQEYGDRVIAGAFRGETERVAPGVIRQRWPACIAELGPRPEFAERAQAIAAELSQAGIQTTVSEGEEATLWRKMAMLVPFALASTAAALPLGGLREDPAWKARLLGSADDLARIAADMGVRVDVSALERAMEGMPYEFRTSMQKDVAGGRPDEIEELTAPILREGRERGIDVSATEELKALAERAAGR